MTSGMGGGSGPTGWRWPVRGPLGCLLWAVILLLVLLLLSILFGGFQRGTKAAPTPRPRAASLVSLVAPAPKL